MKKNILKVLMVLCMFSLSAPVFAGDKETKVENNVKETFKKRYIYEWLTDEKLLNEMDKTTRRLICDFLAREIRQGDKYSENLRKYLKNNKIFSYEKIVENFGKIFGKILKEIEKITIERIKDSRRQLDGFENYIKTDEFKKEYKKYKKSQAESWKMVGASSKAMAYVEKDLIKKYGKKVEEMTEKQRAKYDRELNKKAQNIDKKLQKKFKDEAEKEAKEMKDNAKKFSGKHFKDYVEFRKRELRRGLDHEKGNLENLRKILKNEDTIKTAKEIFVKVNKSLPDNQKEKFDFKKMVDLSKN